jgi:hypothetical protein
MYSNWTPDAYGFSARRRSHPLLWSLLTIVCVLVVGVVVGTVILAGRDRQHESAGNPAMPSVTQTTSPSRNSVPVSALDELLPGKDTLVSVVGDGGLGRGNGGNRIVGDVMVTADCQGIGSVAALPVYAGSGWTAVNWQNWHSPAEPDPEVLTHEVILSVVSYPHSEAANRFYDKASAAWKKCAGRVVNQRYTDQDSTEDSFWTVGEVNDADNVLETSTVNEGGGGWVCQNALTVDNNIIAQAIVCADTPSAAQVHAILDAIRKNIDAAS